MALVHGEKRRVIVFDVEGVLIPKNRYLLFEISKRLNFLQFLRIVFYGILYELGLISLKAALKKVFKVFRGFRVEELLQVFRRIPLMPNVGEVFEKLKREGWKTALISSGLPTFVVEDLASRLKADYAFGLDLETRDGIVTGEISGEVIEHQGKLLVLKRILEVEGGSPEKLVVVADDRNNAPILLPEALKVGYNPDFLVRVKADHVVTGSLVEVLPLIGVEKPRKEASLSKSTVFREAIHACGFTVPFLSSLVGNYAVALLIIAVTFLYVASEAAMMEGKRVPIISWIVHNAATKAEIHEFATAPVFFALGILFTLLLFPISASNAAIATFALGDSAAAIVGKTIGRKRLSFNKGKTLEGLAAGLFAGFLAALVYVNPLKALAAAATATIVESLPLPISDNLTIPLTTALVLTLIA
ncbi:HAD-IB family phosphatase [Candidatus Bathyarchaeota archaeon A05DMB-3]|nr:HAD-IB family phosphatase [Candidatus Bathyarchaeota archaeon A05DMB-3]